MNISRLCDVYGSLLTDHRRELIRSYYDDDLSLAEIAENADITRQAALCSIKQAEAQLNDYESKLGVVEKTDRLEAELRSLITSTEADLDEVKRRISLLISDLR